MTRCIVCNDNTEFVNVDKYRIKPIGMSICKQCGFVTYPKIIEDMGKLKEFYKEDYRNKKAPDQNNIYTGMRKLQFHYAFLQEYFDKWKDKEIVIGEIGSAFGMFLDWFRKIFPKAKLNGVELTKIYRRVAFQMYGIDLKEELDFTKKYDLICSYKVAEHMIDVDKDILKYREALNDDGHLYISIPNWFDGMNNFGMSGFDLEYYYHKNHINVWTKEQFEHILARCGFKIIKMNNTYYDQTYMCVKSDLSSEKFVSQYEMVTESLGKTIEAYKCYEKMDHGKAIEIYPNFPSAHLSNYENNRSKFHENGFDWIKENVIDKAIKDCPNRAEMMMMGGNIAARYDLFELSIDYFNNAAQMKPNTYEALNGISMGLLGLAGKTDDEEIKLKIHRENINVLKFIKEVDIQHRDQTISWLMYVFSQIPLPEEAA